MDRKKCSLLVVGPELPDPNLGGRNRLMAEIRFRYARVGACLVRAATGWMSRSGRPVHVLANHVVAEALSSRPGVLEYDGALSSMTERLDFGAIHVFADRVAQLSRQDDAFAHCGVSLSKIHEIRWVWPIAYSVGFAALTHQEIDRNRIGALASIGINRYLPAACVAAKSAGIRPGVWTRISSSVSSAIDGFGHRRFLARFVRHYLGHDRAQSDRQDLRSRVGAMLNVDTRRRSGNRLILVVGNFDRTLERFEKLWPALQAAGYSAHVLALPRITWDKRLAAQGVSFSFPANWIEPTSIAVMTAKAKKMAPAFCAALEGDGELGNVRCEGQPLFEIARTALFQHVKHGAPSAMLAAEVAERAIQSLLPDLVLGFEDWDFNRALNILAKARNIPTLGYYCLSAPAVAGLVRRTHDTLAVSGKNLRKGFSTQYPASRLRVIGDPLVRPSTSLDRQAIRHQVLAEFGLDVSRPLMLLLMTFPAPGITLRHIETHVTRAFSAAGRMPGMQVLVKAHPAQSLKEIQGWLRRWQCPAVPIVKDGSLFDYCVASDVVVAPVTTAIHQAMMAGTPVLCLQSAESLRPFESMGYDVLAGKGVVHIDTNVDPVPTINALVSDGLVRQDQIMRGYRHVEEHVGPRDGGAARRFLALVDELIENQQISSVASG